MNHLNRFVVLDLETTGHSPAKGDRIIEIGIVVMENEEVVEEFSSFLNPHTSIPAFISNLTGITESHVKDAPVFSDIAEEIIHMFEDAYIVAHNVPFDLGFLNAELQLSGYAALHIPVIDTVELARILLPQAPGYKLGQLAEYFSFMHDNPHRAFSDALATAELLNTLLSKLYTLPYETLVHLLDFEPVLKSDLAILIQNRIDQLAFQEESGTDVEIFRGIALLKREIHDSEEKEKESISFGDLLDQLYEQPEGIRSFLPYFEARKGQRDMSEIVFDAFQSETHGLIEAETGTGKSLAYLIPAIYHAASSQKRVVISTHLTQLQSQLLEKEVPLLKKALPFPFEVAILKGKQHYLSLKRFEAELNSKEYDNYDMTLTKAIILVWLTETLTGDLDEIQLPTSGKQFLSKVSTEAERVLDQASPWYSRSFYQRARVNAQKADIIITNHSLLCTDMTSESYLLPAYQYAILDEAHHLETTASKHFGSKLDYFHVQYLLKQIHVSGQESSWLEKASSQHQQINETLQQFEWERLWQDAMNETDDLFRTIFSSIDHHKKQVAVNDIGRFQYRFGTDDSLENWPTIKEMAMRLSFQLRDLIHVLLEAKKQIQNQEFVSETLEDFSYYTERLQLIIDELEFFFLTNDPLQVKWIEIEAYGARNAVFLYSEPVDVSKLLWEHLFEEKKSVILTSATLTMKQSFDFMKKRIGLEQQEVLETKIQSPYVYEEQVQVMIPSDFPAIQYGKSEDFILSVCEAIYSMAEITQGRMLVLFTSYDMLKKSYRLLKEMNEENSFVLIAQGISSGSRTRLKKNFQLNDKAILLGTSSFWEGVDIPGNDLSCLFIVRLPFQPPDHPSYEAKAEFIKEAGKNPFMDLALPNAVIRFKQGFGRLIRSSTDRGIVFICDDRIMKTRYGKYFVDSIPKVPILYSTTYDLLKKADEWL
ncbi:ATP-dependent DNA helicase DinG [Radiobacillus kanasensis]|uniref:ATP-dependent DNA helicase DinG n=1 Tax=Radiobacillus kanasensis TaxID=2844358 RepID=UPI001E2F1B45|nr:ATP-dependent DNA helicase DinG [Radiobacillus kanasensis]UFU01280.1 ATP-dependent DNA helicase DinG [Radiobacillus kanasensis]